MDQNTQTSRTSWWNQKGQPYKFNIWRCQDTWLDRVANGLLKDKVKNG